MEHDQPKPTDAKFSGADLANELITGMPDHLKTPAAAPEQPAESREVINQPKEYGKSFEAETPVAVLRTSGEIEYDWKVGAFDDEGKPLNPIGPDGSVTVYHTEPDGRHAEKTVSFDKLVSWQPKFMVEQHVRVESESVGSDGWQVAAQLPNGEVQVVKSAGNGKMWRKFLPAVELMKMQMPALTDAEIARRHNVSKSSEVYEGRTRVTVIHGAQDKPAEQPKRGLGRLFRRS